MTVDMPETKDIGIWSNAFRDWAMPFMNLEGVTDVASEAPIIAVHQKEDHATGQMGRGHIDLGVVVFHVGILVTVEQVRAALGLPPVRRYVRSSVAKHFTSSGKGKRVEIKARFVTYCQAQGWNVTDENIADALGTLDLFLFENKAETPWSTVPRKPLFTGNGAATQNKTESRAVERIAQTGMRFSDRGAA